MVRQGGSGGAAGPPRVIVGRLAGLAGCLPGLAGWQAWQAGRLGTSGKNTKTEKILHIDLGTFPDPYDFLKLLP